MIQGLRKMFRYGFALCALLVVSFSISAVHAAEPLVMAAKGETCKSTEMDADHAREESEWRCPGPGGYSLKYYDFTTQGGIIIGFRGKDLPGEGLSWAPANTGIASRAEWRMQNGSPVALIVGRWRNTDDETGAINSAVEELVVIKVAATGTCTVAVIGALAPQAMALAREQADQRSANFRCKTDQPFKSTNLTTDAIELLPHRFSNLEMFDHNGSIVQLKRSRVGRIEIRYKEPRPALKVDPGALLFVGTEHNGLVSGEAFVFKTGCTPAGYPVSGRRNDGVLFLGGAAPSRGSGCELAGFSKKSKHAGLAFEHDPVLTLASEVAATEEALEPARDGPDPSPALLPLEKGYYVDVVSPCKDASNATLTLFNGRSFGTAHQECRKPEVQKQPDGSYQIKEQCRDTQVDGTPWEVSTTKADVLSRTRVDQTTPFGKFSFRYCKQASLPEPWASNDIRALGIK